LDDECKTACQLKYGSLKGCSYGEDVPIEPLSSLCVHTPRPALLDALSIIALLFVIGELVKQIARKATAFTAMLQAFIFAATFYRAGIAPKRFVNMYTACAIHLVPVFTLPTQNATP
jgi:hypothetical protein